MHKPDHADRPSKSQLKREMAALQKLGQEIVELPKDALRKIVLPEALDTAMREAHRITDHEGYRRQLQYIGRLMRQLEPDEVEALRQALQRIKSANYHETGRLHAIERWREQLLEPKEEALTEFIRRYPHANAQEGRTLIRLARREAEQKKPPRYFRELFQWIKHIVEQASGPL